MTPQSMRAAVFANPGPAAEVVRIREVPVPVPQPGELLVRVHAASLHPADSMFIEGRYRVKPRFPQIAGLVGTGSLVHGDASRGWPAGMRVAFRRAGAWAEYCCVPLGRIYPVPDGVDEIQASQFALNPLTAWGLLDMAGVREGGWLAMNAAGSNVAQLTRVLAQGRGIQVIGIHRSLPVGAGNADFADGDRLAERITEWAGGPIDALLDCVGGRAITDVVPALRQGASIVSYGTLGSGRAEMSNADIVYRNLRWCGFGIDHWLDSLGARTGDVVRELWKAMNDLNTPAAGVYPLAEIGRALASATAPAAGKTIVTMRGQDS